MLIQHYGRTRFVEYCIHFHNATTHLFALSDDRHGLEHFFAVFHFVVLHCLSELEGRARVKKRRPSVTKIYLDLTNVDDFLRVGFQTLLKKLYLLLSLQTGRETTIFWIRTLKTRESNLVH